jgi:hypothetical protein
MASRHHVAVRFSALLLPSLEHTHTHHTQYACAPTAPPCPQAGIAVMALDAMAAHPGLQLKLVPIGLHYFSGHKFRSRVFLDIGKPHSQQAYSLHGWRGGGGHCRCG